MELRYNSIMQKPLAIIIEDHEDQATVFSTALQVLGYETEIILDGAVAQKRLKEIIPETMSFLEKKWKEIDSTGTFDYSFLDEEIAAKYRDIKKLGMLFIGFTCVAILIACLGLFGLAMFSVQQRTRDIGIRKALGATAKDIALMLSKSFIKWVLAANIFAWPLAYWFTLNWLGDYPYRIDIGVGLYIFAGLLALAIAMLTVAYQTIKAARGNPVDALRYE